jgi:hypothetical protein
MLVALFITCFNDTLFPGVGIATTRLLERLGLTVDFPEAQTCCGADALQHRLPARGHPARAPLRRGFRGCRGHRRTLGVTDVGAYYPHRVT